MATTVDFSTFKYKIEIQNQTVEIDEYGIPHQTWKTVRKTRAAVQTNSNSKSEKTKSEGTHYFERKEFTIRKLGGIKDTGSRILYNNKAYNIILMEDLDEDGMYLFIMGELQEK